LIPRFNNYSHNTIDDYYCIRYSRYPHRQQAMAKANLERGRSLLWVWKWAGVKSEYMKSYPNPPPP
jgi:hypothetical protein